jgi:EmrB/QacA subfamily drug resistance transporter
VVTDHYRLAMANRGALVVLAAAQFLMVLDQAVMNVSISQLVADFDTDVTTIQGVITLYSLTMAALMITGGKVGDLIGRRRAFAIGLAIYCVGSALTAVSWSVWSLALGWSILEGIGAALVLPALAALIAGNYEGPSRAAAYAVIGGVAGAGIAVGPILGGWVTSELTWRLVFVGEVVVGVGILVGLRTLADVPLGGPAPRLDVVGATLSALGMGIAVLGLLSASTWGWVEPKDSPVEPFGFALTPFVVGAGLVVLWAFVRWQRHREDRGDDPLVHLHLFGVRPLRSGLATFLSQNLILMGVFFTIPLYLQLVQGLDALETGIRMLPVSVTMFLTSVVGAKLASRFSARTLVRVGLAVILVAVFQLIGTIEPELDSAPFAVAMALLGVGMGLMASQLGNVVQSSVGAGDRSEAGGLQYTAQQLGSSIGVALIGAIVLTGLVQNFVTSVADDERISDEVAAQVETATARDASFVAPSQIEAAAGEAGLDQATVDALVEEYGEAQIAALKAGLLAAGFIAVFGLLATGGLPSTRVGTPEEESAESAPGPPGPPG